MIRVPVLLLLACAAWACNEDVWALVDHAPPTTDADLPPVVADAGPDANPDASASVSPWAGMVHGSGFHDHMGLTVYGRVGSTSSEIVSSTVQPDGSFTLQFTQLEVWLASSILYIFIDVTESGSCSNLGDYVGEFLGFLEFADGFEIHITPAHLFPSIWGCFRFRLT
jgi:hypothetical protein